MISSHLQAIERDLSDLSLEELEWLLERIQQQMQNKQETSAKFKNAKYMEKELASMALDLDIQTEISTINQEFMVTEMDGLEHL
jgi:uncharacterized protein YicC (UPF0701 family)